MKKLILIMFIITQLFSTSDIKIPSNTIHSHTHMGSIGIEHVHEHSHAEVSSTLFYQVNKEKNSTFLFKLNYEKPIDLNSQLVIHNIFRPPIS